MSTRATIAVRRSDDFFDAVYLHFDGYPSHTGEALKQHFATQQLAEDLVSGGDLRCLGRATGTPERYSNGTPPAILPTLEVLRDFAKKCGAQFLYVFDDGIWSCAKL